MNCRCCGSGNVKRRWSKAGYEFLQCSDCDLLFIHPLPGEQELNAFYEKDFFLNARTGYQNYEKEQRWRKRNAGRDLELLQTFVQGGRLLDVGCATGSFLAICPDQWECHGQEVSTYAGKEAQKLFGDRIRIAPLKDIDYPANSFDAVTLWETINHMTDPFDDLRKIHHALKPGGILALSVGDAGSWLAKRMGRYWYHVTPPIHAWYFTPKTFQTFFRENGFQMERIVHPGKYVDLGTCLARTRDARDSQLLRKIHERIASGRLGNLTLYLNLKDTMYVFARKTA
jgi:ubiquinone/menaquinone biosynthesis C-methylase UbiE